MERDSKCFMINKVCSERNQESMLETFINRTISIDFLVCVKVSKPGLSNSKKVVDIKHRGEGGRRRANEPKTKQNKTKQSNHHKDNDDGKRHYGTYVSNLEGWSWTYRHLVAFVIKKGFFVNSTILATAKYGWHKTRTTSLSLSLSLSLFSKYREALRLDFDLLFDYTNVRSGLQCEGRREKRTRKNQALACMWRSKGGRLLKCTGGFAYIIHAWMNSWPPNNTDYTEEKAPLQSRLPRTPPVLTSTIAFDLLGDARAMFWGAVKCSGNISL